MKKIICQSNSLSETQEIAEQLIKKLKGGTVILLSGNLGSGKTSFTQGLGKALGIKKCITSPTFVLMKIYPTHHYKIKQLIHIDLYRLKKITNFGLFDYLAPENLVVIEWPEKIKPELPKERIEINFKILNKKKSAVNARKITITYL